LEDAEATVETYGHPIVSADTGMENVYYSSILSVKCGEAFSGIKSIANIPVVESAEPVAAKASDAGGTGLRKEDSSIRSGPVEEAEAAEASDAGGTRIRNKDSSILGGPVEEAETAKASDAGGSRIRNEDSSILGVPVEEAEAFVCQVTPYDVWKEWMKISSKI
jgi:hypothetical protein